MRAEVGREILKDLLSTSRLEATPRAKGELRRLGHHMLAQLIVVDGIGDLALLDKDV